MNRRNMLGLVAGTLGSGCLGRIRGSPTPRPVSRSRLHGFRFEVATVKPESTADHPPLVRIRVTNTTDQEHTLTVSNYTFPVVPTGPTGDGPAILVPNEEGFVPSSRRGGCWRGLLRVRPAPNGKRFQPDESVSREYAVLTSESADSEGASESASSDARSRTCLPAGDYEFGQSYVLDARRVDSLEGGTEFEWRFTVVVTDDGSIGVA